MQLLVDGDGSFEWHHDAGIAQAIRDFLEDTVNKVEMTIIAGPWVQIGEGDEPDSGLVFLAESHIAVHINQPAERFHIDIFSCKAFSLPAALAHIASNFHFKALNIQVLDRGNLYE